MNAWHLSHLHALSYIGPYFRVARKLRHAVLYRDCITFIAGSWDGEPFANLEYLDADDLVVVNKAKTRLYELLERAHRALLAVETEDDYMKDMVDGLELHEPPSMPRYFRQISELEYANDSEAGTEYFKVLKQLLDNNLRMFWTNAIPGRGVQQMYFFCATVPDDELPWDIIETDW